jgi:5'-nucleotidase/UDP-sugar diphosphatase
MISLTHINQFPHSRIIQGAAMNAKKFTLLHSNDIHGDFLAESGAEGQSQHIGGLSLLSSYITKVRKEEENVLYVIAGDMVQGSLIDSEYKGISTMEIMNYLAPDVACLGNHEFDYGLPHLLFLEKMANFPIVNANLYIRQYNKRLMRPFVILNKAGFDLLFTGIITDKVIDAINKDNLVGSFVALEEASQEVGKICNAYKNADIDLTVLLTHIGLESDIQLAKLLNPDWGVDMIIGGHSHSFMDKPANINNVLIAHSGSGTNQIGRFDIVVDDDTNSIVDYRWELVKIDDSLVAPDKTLENYIDSFRDAVDRKYGAIITKLAATLTHPQREIETSLGNLIADALAEVAECDVMLVGSGSIRVKELGPLVTLSDLRTCFPYDDTLTRYQVFGAQLKRLFAHVMRAENRNSEGECYQVNQGVCAVYNEARRELDALKVNNELVIDSRMYSIGLPGFHFNNAEKYLGVSQAEFLASGKSRVVATSALQVLEEYLRNHQNLKKAVEGRLVFHS